MTTPARRGAGGVGAVRIVAARLAAGARARRPARAVVLREAGVFALYLALAIFATWPWIGELWSRAAVGDSSVYGWDIYWSAKSVLGLHSPWFSPEVFAPEGTYLTNHSLLLLPAVLELPLIAAIGAFLTYNVSILLWLALAAYGGYRLAAVITGSRIAAIVAGTLYGMGPIIVFRTVQPGMVLAAALLPFSLLAARALMRRRSVGSAVGLGLMLAVAMLTDVLAAAYVLIAVAAYVGVIAVRNRSWRTPRAALLVGVVLLTAGVATSPQQVAIAQASRTEDYQTPANIAAASSTIYGSDAAQFVLPSLFSRHLGDVYLDAAGRFKGLLTRQNGPVAIGWATLLLAAIGLAARRRHRTARRLALAGLACFVLSMGSVLRILGTDYRPLPVSYEGYRMSGVMPYTWLVRVPFLRNVRVPDRFAVVGILPIAMLAGLGADALLRRRRRVAQGAVAGLAVFGVVEGAMTLKGDLPIDDPVITAPIRGDRSDSIVVDAPLGWASGASLVGQVYPASRAMLRATQHGHRIAAGYVARISPVRLGRLLSHPLYLEILRLQGRNEGTPLPTCPAVTPGSAARDAVALDARWVVLWPDADRALVPFLGEVGYVRQAESRGVILYRLGARPVGPGPTGAPSALFCSGFEPPQPVGSTDIRWMGGAQGTIEVGVEGVRRPGLAIHTAVQSLAHPRRLAVRLGRRVLLQTTVGAASAQPIVIHLPAGRGVARLRVDVSPGASPASEVNPIDPRLLSVYFTDLQVRRR
ncbi:MAG: hypothetical protein QOK40_3311 [Miltoncostaeaceae bacterium]|nr:hypothetical protein [Miltoncostaeaceae bacterium]